MNVQSTAVVLGRYRWELIPLLTLAIAGLLGQVLVTASATFTSYVITFALLLAASLGLLLAFPRVRREGRPLLNALWLVSVLPTAGASTSLVASHVSGLGALFPVGLVIAVAIVVWLGVRYAGYGMRFALLVPAGYFALGAMRSGFDAIAWLIGPFWRPFPHGTFVDVLVFACLIGANWIGAFVALMATAYVFHYAMVMAQQRLRKFIILLLSLSVGMAAIQFPDIAMWAPYLWASYEDGRLTVLGAVVSSMAFQMGNIVVILGLTLGLAWLFTRRKAPGPDQYNQPEWARHARNPLPPQWPRAPD